MSVPKAIFTPGSDRLSFLGVSPDLQLLALRDEFLRIAADALMDIESRRRIGATLLHQLDPFLRKATTHARWRSRAPRHLLRP